MKLTKLYLNRINYGPESGSFKGTIEFDGERGKVEVNLDHSLSNALLAVIADQLVATAKTAAERLLVEIVAATSAPVEKA